MRIRQATAADAGAITAFWNPQIRDTAVTFSTLEKTSGTLAGDIDARLSEGKAFYVAEVKGAVQGFATYFQFRGGPGYARTMEHTVVLAPGVRGQGVGRALMREIEDHARARGIHSMIAGVSSENPAGIAFHEKLGYCHVARIPEVGYKFGRWMDLVLLQKML